MHLEVRCPVNNAPITIAGAALVRAELPETFTVVCPLDGVAHNFTRRDVRAVPDVNPTTPLMVLGGLVGLFTGGWGLAIGAAIGAGAGSIARKHDENAALAFNNS